MKRAGAKVESVAEQVRQAIEAGGERVWRIRDFPGSSTSAVLQALSRLTKEGTIDRIERGIYYRPRPTSFGKSRPNPKVLRDIAERESPIHPSGLTAANLLGFSTQVPAREELATPRSSLPRNLVGRTARIRTGRPASWSKLSAREAAILEFIRSGGSTSELAPKETLKKLLSHLETDRTFENLLIVALNEPPRVRAMLGALGEALGKHEYTLRGLKRSLNPRSRFDFGVLSVMASTHRWQAKSKKSSFYTDEYFQGSLNRDS